MEEKSQALHTRSLMCRHKTYSFRKLVDYGEIENIFSHETNIEDCDVFASRQYDKNQNANWNYNQDLLPITTATTKHNSVYSRLGPKPDVDKDGRELNTESFRNSELKKPEVNIYEARKVKQTSVIAIDNDTANGVFAQGTLKKDDRQHDEQKSTRKRTHYPTTRSDNSTKKQRTTTPNKSQSPGRRRSQSPFRQHSQSRDRRHNQLSDRRRSQSRDSRRSQLRGSRRSQSRDGRRSKSGDRRRSVSRYRRCPKPRGGRYSPDFGLMEIDNNSIPHDANKARLMREQHSLNLPNHRRPRGAHLTERKNNYLALETERRHHFSNEINFNKDINQISCTEIFTGFDANSSCNFINKSGYASTQITSARSRVDERAAVTSYDHKSHGSHSRFPNSERKKSGIQRNGLETSAENMNLESLKHMDSDDLVLHLNAHNSDLDTFLWKEDIIRDLPFFLQLMRKVCKHPSEDLVKKALKPFTDGRNFFARSDVQDLIANMRVNFKMGDTQTIICIVELMQHIFCNNNKYQSAMILLLDSIELTTERNVKESTQKEEIFQLIGSIRNDKLEKSAVRKSVNYTLKILPELEEIDSLDQLQIEANYQNEEDYLKRLFLVHRQDFIKPLCRGLLCLKHAISTDPECLQRNWRNDDIRVFRSVQFIVRCCSEQDGITIKVSFDISQYRKVNWKTRKILVYGSLVCLVSKEFTFLKYATVSGRDELERGLLDIRIDKGNDTIEAFFGQVEVLLVESQAFYPSYFHTLNSIKETFEEVKEERDTLPLGRQLLSTRANQGDPEVPDYFRTEVFREEGFDISWICDTGEENVDISCEGNWPHASSLGLDVSQYEALVSSMKNKLALIQGPPGTGKTVVGLKIAELLLWNEHVWRNPTEGTNKGPMLLLCYTNHALDQFLLDVMKQFPQHKNDEFVRLGSKSEVDELKKINLTVKRRERFTYRTVEKVGRRGRIYFKTIREVKHIPNVAADEERCNLKRRISEHDNLKKMRQELTTGIVSLTWLYKIAGVVTDKQYDQLSTHGSFLQWLDLFNCAQINCKAIVDNTLENDYFEYFDEEESYHQSYDDDSDDEETELTKMRLMHLDCEKLIMEVPCDMINHSYQVGKKETPFWANLNKEERILLGQLVRKKMYYTKAFECDSLYDFNNVWDLSMDDRWSLYKYWQEQALIPIDMEIKKCEMSFENAQKRYLQIQRIADANILRRAKMIACTTTRAARDIDILRQVSPSIILMEEAAEIPEHHVIASLTSSCQQLIMIGDHQQLRPSYNDYATAREHRINISLFERLIKNGFPYRQLKYQHRMRPCFSRLLVPHIYKSLFDDDSVLGREHVYGMQNDLFFISHSVYEDSDREELSRSHKSLHEATYVGYLYRYLRMQGYSANRITILSTYLDQVRLLRSTIRSIEGSFEVDDDIQKNVDQQKDGNLQQVRITAVDNFQGEENDIILLSLVRSNASSNIGYLSETNRICVALSRAKIGLYVIGNFEQLVAKSRVWKNIIGTADTYGFVGKVLSLLCKNHKTVTNIGKLEDFQFVTDGGCTEPCKVKRDCGHFCSRKCHSNDTNHHGKCTKQCVKTCNEGSHKCSSPCHHPFRCPPCKEKVEKKIPVCGHSKIMFCHVDPENESCIHRCTKTMSCGHQCQKICSEPCTEEEKCNELIKTKALCGHEVQVACKTKYNPPCIIKCEAELKCGHKCRGTCSACSQGRLHMPCQENCKRSLVCGHMCTQKCNMNCPPCGKKCDRKCSHHHDRDCRRVCGEICKKRCMEACKKKCRDACIECHEICQWQCRKTCPNNYRCNRLCFQPCARPKCNTPCQRVLFCGHKCSGLMCEKCHKALCKSCNTQLTELFYGHEDESDAVFIKLEDCNCTFEIRDLDKHVKITLDSLQEDGIRPLKCPRCTVTITKSKRYTNELKIINKQIEEVFWTISNTLSIDLFSKRQELRHKITASIIEHAALEKLKTEIDKTRSIKEIDRITDKFSFLNETAELNIAAKKLSVVPGFILAGIQHLNQWVNHRRFRYSDQEHEEFVLETRRLRLIIQIHSMQDQIMGQKVLLPDIISKYLKRLQSISKINDDDISEMKNKTDEVSLKMFGLTIDEKKMIKRAMKEFRGSGHWYRCKNGHVYSIGECGMPMEQRKCPECDSTIGGRGHLLNDDNDRDQEMEVI